ncbi:hypothetical protein SAMN06298216_1128 [Spirosomataceae bacterium TFI 002]|nr:hypothetical protein SAMN06298216_1128 [Spirosomataceae bacterium TFI 002]
MLKYLLFFIPNILFAQGVSLISGTVIDSRTHKPLQEAIIYMPNNAYSTGLNNEGKFRMYYPNIDADSSIIFTKVGYSVAKTTPAQLAANLNIVIELDSLPHLDMSYGISDATVLVQSAIDSIPRNYPATAFAQVGFFRETIELDRLGFVKINEATIRIERFPEEKDERSKLKLLQSRKFEWEGQSSKVAAFGLGNSTEIVTRSFETEIPDFLTKKKLRDYNFNIDSLMVPFLDTRLFAISFSPRKQNLSGGRTGKLYLDPESKAIVRVAYEMTPKGMSEIFKSGLGSIKITGEKISSTTQYFPSGEKWFLSQNNLSLNALFEDKLDKKFKTNASFNLDFISSNSNSIKRSAIREMEEIMRSGGFTESNSFNATFWRRENFVEPTEKMKEIISNKSKKE